jgi:hypothetical protein
MGRRRPGQAFACVIHHFTNGQYGKDHFERRTKTLAWTLHLNASTMGVHYIFYDRKAKTQSSELPCETRVLLQKPFKYMRLKCGIDPLPLISNNQDDLRLLFFQDDSRLNLMALERRFQTTCRSRSASPPTMPAA